MQIIAIFLILISSSCLHHLKKDEFIKNNLQKTIEKVKKNKGELIIPPFLNKEKPYEN